MALPVWVVPAAKTVGKWVLTNAGPQLVDLTKKYGPAAFRGYRQHGFKPKQIVAYVIDEVAPAKPVEAKASAPVKRPRKAKP